MMHGARPQSLLRTQPSPAVQNRDRVTDRSSIELGATLQAIHRLSPHVSKKDRVPTLVKQLRKDLVREMKRTVKKMPARTIANCIFNMASLKLADKALMSKTVDAIGSRRAPCCPFGLACSVQSAPMPAVQHAACLRAATNAGFTGTPRRSRW